VRTLLLLATLLLVAVAITPAANEIPEQSVTPVVPGGEQRIEAVAPAAEQHVQALDATGAQQAVTGGHKGPVRRGAEATGKVVLGVFAAVISLGAMAASLLFL
jgi:hypothetical protein